MSRPYRGPFIAATWLIGLGVIFLLKEALDLPWNQAWPLFVILSGAAGFVSALVAGPRHGGIWTFTWPVAWFIVGVILLYSTTGNLGVGPGELIVAGWPWAAIALGVWFLVGAVVGGGRGPVTDVVVPLEPATDASIRIRFGAGRLTTTRAAAGHLVDGTFHGGADVQRRGPNRLEVAQDFTFGFPWLDHPSEWTVGLTGERPLDLRVDTGASQAFLDLGDLLVRSLDVRTGASETRVRLPFAAGATTVHAEAGAASLVFEVPAGVAARIRTRVALGSSQVDESRFPRIGDSFQSPDYASATNRVDIDVQGGVGSVRVVGGAGGAAPSPAPSPDAATSGMGVGQGIG